MVLHAQGVPCRFTYACVIQYSGNIQNEAATWAYRELLNPRLLVLRRRACIFQHGSLNCNTSGLRNDEDPRNPAEERQLWLAFVNTSKKRISR